MTEALIFDFDGVILESVETKTHAFSELYRSWGPEVVKKVVSHHLAHGGMSRYLKIRHYHENFLHTSISDDELETLCRRFSRLVEQAVTESAFVPGAEDFFETAPGRIPFYIASGTPEAELQRIVKARNLDGFFQGVFGSPRGKRTIIDEIIVEHSYNRQGVYMIGDAHGDYEAARDTGVGFVGRVPEGQPSPFPRDVISFASPYAYLRGLMEGVPEPTLLNNSH